jgi:hypothetical protein
VPDSRAGYFVLAPEPAGHLQGGGGDHVCVFDTWLGDDIVRAHPLLLVTTPLKRELDALAGARGFSVGRARCQTSLFFRRHNPGRRLPPFWALRVDGDAGIHDVGLARDGSIIIS